MNFIIHFTTSTRRLLDQRWHKALKQKQLQLVKRITALQWLAEGQGPKVIAARLEVATSTVYAWLSAFLHQGEKALE